jgi:hypothetical protein
MRVLPDGTVAEELQFDLMQGGKRMGEGSETVVQAPVIKNGKIDVAGISDANFKATLSTTEYNKWKAEKAV